MSMEERRREGRKVRGQELAKEDALPNTLGNVVYVLINEPTHFVCIL